MSSIPLQTPGHVYILGTDSHTFLKIGATTYHPEVRAYQLTNATASPHPFRVLYSREVPDCNAYEAALHKCFEDRRVNKGREFFQVSLDEAAIALDDLCGDMRYVASMPIPLPFSELFASFPDDGDDRPLTQDEQFACRQLEQSL